MSGKSARKVKLTPPPPRASEVIREDYSRTVAEAGQIQIQIAMLTRALSSTTQKAMALGDELAARKALDESTQVKETPHES